MRTIILAVCGLILSVVLPIVLLHTNVLKDASGLDLFSYGVGIVGISVTVLYTIFDARLGYMERSVDRIPSHLAGGVEKMVVDLNESIKDMAEIRVFTVDRETLYATLQDFIVGAKRRVDLMYCGVKPPSNYLRSASKESYVGQLDRTIKEHGKTVRRAIRYTADNREWIRSVIDTHMGNESFSLSIIDIDPSVPLISAQIVDSDKCILMNMNRSTAPDKPRDLVFHSEKITGIVDSYFEDMFTRATPILVNGRPHDENIKQYFG